jgi:hypothetical protein
MVRNSGTLLLVRIKEKADPGSRWVEVSVFQVSLFLGFKA